MANNDGFQGVSNCYVFKSRLQEYAQKVGLPTPVYETIKEGPSHEPFFRSTVTVNGIRFNSLPRFFNRKAAEQSAAEVALKELAKSVDVDQRLSLPVHETGLCKNLLQEYAQKMNYAMPSYQYKKVETQGRMPLFSCTVEIGDIRYIGAAARTKKEAEIKAARTALLAIQMSTPHPLEKPVDNSQLTVIPCKKRGTDTNISEETTDTSKVKKSRFRKRKHSGGNACKSQVGPIGRPQSNRDVGKKSDVVTSASALGCMEVDAESTLEDKKYQSEQEQSAAKVPLVDSNFENGQSTFSNTNISKKATTLLKKLDTVSGVGGVVSPSKICEIDASEVGTRQLADSAPLAIFEDVKQQQSKHQKPSTEDMEVGSHTRGQDTDASETSHRQYAATATLVFQDESQCGVEGTFVPLMDANIAQ